MQYTLLNSGISVPICTFRFIVAQPNSISKANGLESRESIAITPEILGFCAWTPYIPVYLMLKLYTVRRLFNYIKDSGAEGRRIGAVSGSMRVWVL
ncbi:hypothetical protein EYR41_005053 [Orbilia oligospora]|uniref:Uncharacterized protein n=1 Tax=Orbilia oligospora TaxID=2813651 RepID=A0A8H2E1Z4_ORBOL|nr:hypothetical protein EYR41_005053 [Orbilia oligospora]